MDIIKYEKMRDEGSTPNEVYLAAKGDGVSTINQMKIIRILFDLSLVDAKQVAITADRIATSLNEHQAKLADILEEAIEEFESEE